MPSRQHQEMVEAIIAGFDGKTPTVSEIPPSHEELQAARKQMDDMAPTIPSDVRVEACDAGGVPGIWFVAPEADPGRVVLYFHGGGYNYGSPRNTGAVIERISRAAQARCLGLDYRLCWQAPFPAAVEDAASAYQWLLSQGVHPRRLAVAGDSAGGGLALALLTVLRDSGLPQPAAGVLTSAWTDLAVTGRSAVEVDDPICNDKGLLALAQGYLNGADPKTPTASPLYADLSGLCPLLIQVGTREALLDDSLRVAQKARAAGVDVTLEAYEDVIHIWQYFGPDIPESVQSVASVGEFVRKHAA